MPWTYPFLTANSDQPGKSGLGPALELKLEVVTWGSLGSDDPFYLPFLFLSSASALEEAVDGGLLKPLDLA